MRINDEGVQEVLGGRIIKSIEGLEAESVVVIITFDDGDKVEFAHEEDCCAVAALNDFGDVTADDFVGAIIHEAYVSSNSENPPDKKYLDSFTWTFYRIMTSNGPLVMRWLGESNGYYSERVGITLFKKKP